MTRPDVSDLKITTLADVEAERVEWLWKGRLPRGKLVVFDGDPELGKSTLGLTFAAVITSSRRPR
jgi:KaiC/GvpD/RAD55 family RecA-like ATPase